MRCTPSHHTPTRSAKSLADGMMGRGDDRTREGVGRFPNRSTHTPQSKAKPAIQCDASPSLPPSAGHRPSAGSGRRSMGYSSRSQPNPSAPRPAIDISSPKSSRNAFWGRKPPVGPPLAPKIRGRAGHLPRQAEPGAAAPHLCDDGACVVVRPTLLVLFGLDLIGWCASIRLIDAALPPRLLSRPLHHTHSHHHRQCSVGSGVAGC